MLIATLSRLVGDSPNQVVAKALSLQSRPLQYQVSTSLGMVSNLAAFGFGFKGFVPGVIDLNGRASPFFLYPDQGCH